jgi:hypothetical protein
MREIELREKKIRIAFDDIWDIIYKLDYRFTQRRPYIETIRTIMYTPKDDMKSKVKVL